MDRYMERVMREKRIGEHESSQSRELFWWALFIMVLAIGAGFVHLAPTLLVFQVFVVVFFVGMLFLLLSMIIGIAFISRR